MRRSLEDRLGVTASCFEGMRQTARIATIIERYKLSADVHCVFRLGVMYVGCPLM